MFYQLFLNPLSFLGFVFALLVAITIHEFAHAAVADHLGDPTPRLSGRLTLNPLAHLDPLGTIMLFLFRFGWGKPVPIDPFNLQHPRRDQALISLAGPASNLATAFLFSLALRFLPFFHFSFFVSFFHQLILLNIVLSLFNLLPIHPLDGFKVVLGFLPPQWAWQWEELAPLGPLFLFLLIFPLFGQSLISVLLSPVINLLLKILIPYGYTLI